MNTTQEHTSTKVSKTLAYVAILTISLLGNTLLIVAIKRNINGRMITVSNLLIASVAVSDIMLAVWSFPERITRTVADDTWLVHGVAGSILCKIVNFTEKLSITVSIVHLGALAFERFLAVYCPYKTIIKTSYVKYIIGCIWASSAIYWSPILYYGKIVGDKNVRCEVRRFVEHWKSWYMAFIVILCAIMIAILVLYTGIAIKLCHRKNHTLILATQRNKSERIKRQVVAMVGVIIVTFYVCFVPYWIGWVWCSYASTMPNYICNETYKFISIFLANTSCITNPIICFTFIGYFRFAFKAILQDPLNRRAHELRARTRRRSSATEPDTIVAPQKKSVDNGRNKLLAHKVEEDEEEIEARNGLLTIINLQSTKLSNDSIQLLTMTLPMHEQKPTTIDNNEIEQKQEGFDSIGEKTDAIGGNSDDNCSSGDVFTLYGTPL